jgi:hypothetical protein
MERAVAAALVGSMLLLGSSLPVAAATPGSIEGRVLTGASGDPRSGVVVMLVDDASKATYRSASTDERGAFKIEGAAPGTYQLLVDAPEGAFLAASRMNVRSGPNRRVSLTLKERSGERSGGRAEGDAPKAAPASGELRTWEKWLIAGGVLAGSLLVVNEVTEDEGKASAF